MLAATLILANGCAAGPGVHFARVIGATEVMRVEEAQLDFAARIDTGARTTSLHALELEIEDPASRVEDNVGRKIRFRVFNERGQSARLSSVIADIVRVRQPQGTEFRYAVPLHLTWQGVRKELLVNLRDRSAMEYKLLVGRDWIRGSFLVDVDRNSGE